MTTDDKYSSRNIQNLTHNFKRLCLKNKRLSIGFLLHMSNLEEVQTILSKKMSLLASVFMKLLMAKKDVT